MPIFRIIHSLLISFTILAASLSCQRPMNLKAEKDAQVIANQNEVFHTYPSKTLFKATIRIKEEKFSGLLFIKNHENGKKESAFLTQTGLKMFEVTYTKAHNVEIRKLLPAIDKMPIRKGLKKYFSMLFSSWDTQNPNVYRSETHQAIKTGKRYFVYDKESEQLTHIFSTNLIKKPDHLQVTNNDHQDTIKNINFTQLQPRITIDLKRLDRTH